MKSCPWFLALVLSVSLTRGEAPPATGPAIDAWVSAYARYARDHANPSGDELKAVLHPHSISLFEVLRTLPPPEGWPGLRAALAAAADRVPAAQVVEKLRLQSGAWLLDDLMGERAAVAGEIAEAEKNAERAGRKAVAGNLKEWSNALGEVKPGEIPPEQLVAAVEARIAMYEPINLDDVKKAVKGEENFAHLNHILAVGKLTAQRYREAYAAYEKDKDEAAARAKMETINVEAGREVEADRKALEPYLENPLIARYFSESSLAEMNESGYVPSLEIPDLVGKIGRDRAATLLRRALRTRAEVRVGSAKTGDGTRQLAQEILLADIDEIKSPAWNLVDGEASGQVYEALRPRFPAPKSASARYPFEEASGHYLTALIAQGRAGDAMKFATEMDAAGPKPEYGSGVVSYLYQIDDTHPKELWDFLRLWLASHPGTDEWTRFNRLSAQLERRDEARALIKELAANGAFAGIDRMTVQHLLANSELAAGELTVGIERLRALVATPAATKAERSEQLSITERVLNLADLQGDAATFTDTLAKAEKILAHARETDADEALSGMALLMSTLNETHRPAEVARLGKTASIWMEARKKAADAKAKPTEDLGLGMDSIAFRDILAEQLRAEVELAHWDEAQALLQENSWWDATDVAGLLSRRGANQGRPLGYYAGRVAMARGEKVLARQIMEAQLVAAPADDAVYAAYLEIAGDDAKALWEKMAAADRYEERPLIWQARLEMNAGHWDVATAILQQAITIDPSDGEEGRDDRMRVYAFMSEAKKAQGDTKAAAFLADVVKSIRLSETADRWYEAGAYAKAIELYMAALGFFRDAYCIQSRLALRLADAGKMDEAAEHYRHAFELMPGSFGRVESHCFGCEHVFAGEKSQGVAGEVFSRLLKANPRQPQLHYLSGYLREEQKRAAEAATFYREAVALDPLYLNAWNRLADLDSELKFTPQQRDDILLKLTELDPGRKHVSPNHDSVTDLRRLWRSLHAAEQALAELPKPGPLQPLKAAALRTGNNSQPEDQSWRSERADFGRIVLHRVFVVRLEDFLRVLANPEAEQKE